VGYRERNFTKNLLQRAIGGSAEVSNEILLNSQQVIIEVRIIWEDQRIKEVIPLANTKIRPY